MNGSEFDYIVVGAGAAGCAVANRLSEDSSTRVLLLEAGGRDLSPLIHVPVGFTKLTSPSVNWGFETAPQAQLDGRRMWYPQGRTLGGSTSINAMIYIRGQAQDYDGWRDAGNPGWGYDDVLPFFRKAEHNERLADDYHGNDGPMNVTEQIECNLLTRAFVRANQELGLSFNHDFNGATQEGVGFYDVTQRDARRESAATAYLRPARGRPNLTIHTNSLATRIQVSGGVARGVEYLHRGRATKASARREVILSSGAINSPRLLLLSGIGPADELGALGVPVVHDLPGVGKNLQDHMDVYLTAHTTPVSFNESDRPDRAALYTLEYLMFKNGPLTACVCEAGAFLKSSAEVETPDIQIHCLPAFVIDHGRQRVKGHGMTINTCHLRPRSIGEVTLRSSNPADMPVINPNFLADPYDWRISLAAFQWGRRLLSSEALKPFVLSEHMPGASVQTEEEIRAYIRRWAKTDYHPVGTCKMGSDELAVVDTDLRVHGLDGLRVIDASIMPKLISGNTSAASTMIGEKGAHHVLHGSLAAASGGAAR